MSYNKRNALEANLGAYPPKALKDCGVEMHSELE